MRTEIFYGGIPVFSGLCPTPLVGRDNSFVSYGSRWASVEQISLEGVITGSQDLSGMINSQKQLLDGFSDNFKSLSISEDGSEIFRLDNVKINTINFPANNYSYLLPFDISLEGYPSGLFSGVFGVLDPIDSFSFSEADDGIVSLEHSISARGINTSPTANNALQNAIDFCASKTGLNSAVTPTFLSVSNISNSVLQTVSQTVDRLSASCAINESWSYDPILGGTGLLRYNTSFDSGAEAGIVTASLQGSLQGGHNVDLSALRTRFGSLDPYDLVSDSFGTFFTGVLNPVELSFNISEDTTNNSINFNYQFDSDPRPNPSISDTVSINADLLNGQKTISTEVTFKWRGNCRCNDEYGWNQLISAAHSFNYLQLVQDRNNYYDPGSLINPNPVASGISEDKNRCELSASFEFKHMRSGLIPPNPLQDFKYNVNIRPSLPQYSAKPTICEGVYSIYDLDTFNRAEFSINGEAIMKPCSDLASGKIVTKCLVENLASKIVYGEDVVITAQSITKSRPFNDTLSFSYSWTSKVPPIFPSGILAV